MCGDRRMKLKQEKNTFQISIGIIDNLCFEPKKKSIIYFYTELLFLFIVPKRMRAGLRNKYFFNDT